MENLERLLEAESRASRRKSGSKKLSPSFWREMSSSSGELLRELNRLRMTGTFCDAVLATKDGATFRVHKVVMSWCSNYFRALFTTSLLDKSSGEGQNSKSYFLIPNVSSSILEAIVKYAYSGTVEVTKESVNKLLPAADQFNVEGVVKKCMDFMLNNMNSENCVGIWRFGKEYYMSRLETEAKRFLLSHFVEVSMNSEEYLLLSLKDLKVLLKDNSLNTPNEFLVWIAIKRWCQYKYMDRQRFFPCLFKCVRLAMLQIKEFRQVMNDPRIYCDQKCKIYIDIISKFILNQLKDVSIITQSKRVLLMFTPRHPYEIIFAAGGWTLSGPTNIFEVYDCRANLWKMLFMEDLGPRSYHQTVPLGDYIYFIGGTSAEQCLNSCWRFNTFSMKCEEIPPMQEKRCYVSAAILNDKIYAIGGFDGYQRLQTVEYFDQHQNQWTYVSPMNECRSDASAASLRDRLFVAGGFDGEAFLRSAECYYAAFDQWFLLPPMLRPRSGLGCALLGDCLYAIGGFDGQSRLRSVEKYSVRDRQWFPTRDMRTARSNFAVSVLEKKIYVMGGYNEDVDSTTDDMECYDPLKPCWLTMASMNVGRSGFSSCTLSGVRDINPYIKDDRFRCLLKNVSKDETKDLLADCGFSELATF